MKDERKVGCPKCGETIVTDREIVQCGRCGELIETSTHPERKREYKGDWK